jgi:hypothetical protein
MNSSSQARKPFILQLKPDAAAGRDIVNIWFVACDCRSSRLFYL